MNLKEEFKMNGHNLLENVGNNRSLLDGIIDTYNGGIVANETKDQSVKEGLCISCDNRGNCQWEENNKIHCEHYQ